MSEIAKRFGQTTALDGVSLSVAAGEILALVGENGAGKSTLMKVLSGAHAPDSGTMSLDGQPYRPRNPMHARRAGVAMIYQELSLAPDLSVAENVMLGVEPTAGPILRWCALRIKAREALSQVGRGDLDVDLPVSRLSIADRQLVEIARALAIGCRVLVLDEPTSSLTSSDIQKLFTLVRKLAAAGHAIVYISHFLAEVSEISQRVEVLRDGKNVGGGATAELSHDRVISLMVGRDVKDLYPRSGRKPGEVILATDNLCGASKPYKANLELRRGEVLGIAGLVGAGRTELLRTIFGLDTVKSGRVRIGAFVGPAKPALRWSQKLGLVSEDRKLEGLALNLSIADNLTMPSLKFAVNPRKQDRQCRTFAQRLAIKFRSPRQSAGELSGGNQQKITLARLLHADVDVLLLDEPTRGIDVGAKAKIYQAIDELAAAGKAVLVVSSYLPELLGICDCIAVMHRGELLPARPVSEVSEQSIMYEATGAGYGK